MLFRGHDVNLSGAAEVSQSSFTQSTAHDRFDQTPRGRYFAADVNARRIDGVNDGRETETEITRGGVDRRQRLCIAGASARDQILDGETHRLRFTRPRIRKIAPEVTRQRRQVRNVRLPTTGRAARTSWTIDAQRHVSKLACRVVPPAHHFAIHDYAHAHAVRDADEHRISGRDDVAARRPQL